MPKRRRVGRRVGPAHAFLAVPVACRSRRRSPAARRRGTASPAEDVLHGPEEVDALRKPRNSGGSPSGVSEPPALLTMKMKKTTTCATCLRLSLARISGRISSIDAPVVPMKLASTAPMAMKRDVQRRAAVQVAAHVDAAGRREQRDQQDDERHVFGDAACGPARAPRPPAPNASANGSRKASAQPSAILPKWWCQSCGASSGSRAIDSSMPANGTPHQADNARRRVPRHSTAAGAQERRERRDRHACPSERLVAFVVGGDAIRGKCAKPATGSRSVTSVFSTASGRRWPSDMPQTSFSSRRRAAGRSAMMRWNCVNAACGQVSRPRAARSDHDVLQEHAVVEPAALPHDAVDGEDQADRRIEEDVVAAVLRVHARLVGLVDAEQAVQVPADLAPPVDVRATPLGRVVGVLLAVRSRARPGRRRRRGSCADSCACASPVSTWTFHGCVFVPDGARDATARISSIVSRGTGVGRKARIERREVIAASTAAIDCGVGGAEFIGADCCHRFASCASASRAKRARAAAPPCRRCRGRSRRPSTARPGCGARAPRRTRAGRARPGRRR